MTHDEIIEVMSDASRSVSRRDLEPESWLDDSEIRDMMESALSALEARGMAVVPKKCTPAMIQAGDNANPAARAQAWHDKTDPDIVGPIAARNVYCAMLAAKE